MSDDAKKAILARRARFIAAAMTGVGLGASCDSTPPEPRNQVEVTPPETNPIQCLSYVPPELPEPSAGADAGSDAGAADGGPKPDGGADAGPAKPRPPPQVCLSVAPPKPPPQVCLSVAPPRPPTPMPQPCLDLPPPPEDDGK